MCDHVLRKYKLFAHYAIKTTAKQTTEASLDFSFARIRFIRNAKINRCHSLSEEVMTTNLSLASSYLAEEALLHKHFKFILHIVDLVGKFLFRCLCGCREDYNLQQTTCFRHIEKLLY